MKDNKKYAINLNSLADSKFPITIYQEKKNNIFGLDLVPIRLIHVLGCLNNLEKMHFCVFSVDCPYSKPLQVTRNSDYFNNICKENKVILEFIDDDKFIIDYKNLLLLLQHFEHFNINVVGITKELLNEKIIHKIDEYKYPDYLLSICEDADIFLKLHDDCFLSLECRDEQIVLDSINELLRQVLNSPDFHKNKTIIENNLYMDKLLKHSSLTLIEKGEKWCVYNAAYPYFAGEEETNEFQKNIIGEIFIEDGKAVYKPY